MDFLAYFLFPLQKVLMYLQPVLRNTPQNLPSSVKLRVTLTFEDLTVNVCFKHALGA